MVPDGILVFIYIQMASLFPLKTTRVVDSFRQAATVDPQCVISVDVWETILYKHSMFRPGSVSTGTHQLLPKAFKLKGMAG